MNLIEKILFEKIQKSSIKSETELENGIVVGWGTFISTGKKSYNVFAYAGKKGDYKIHYMDVKPAYLSIKKYDNYNKAEAGFKKKKKKLEVLKKNQYREIINIMKE